jgi:hypothetical protein
VWDGGHLGRRTSLQGGPGKPLAHPDVPRRVLEAPWTWVSWEVPRTSPVLPGLSGRPRSSPKFPWGFLGFRTSQRLLAASSGRPDVPGASPGLPGTSGCARGGCSGLFEVSYAFPEVSQTGMTDRIPPVSEAAAVPAHQRHVLVSVHWFETFVAVPPPRWSIMVGSESGKLVCWFYFVRHRAVSARQAPPEHSQTGSSQRHGGLGR